MNLDPAIIAKIATAANVDTEYATAWMEAFAATATKLVAAGEVDIDSIDLPKVHAVMQARLKRFFAANVDRIAGEVWDRVHATA